MMDVDEPRPATAPMNPALLQPAPPLLQPAPPPLLQPAPPPLLQPAPPPLLQPAPPRAAALAAALAEYHRHALHAVFGAQDPYNPTSFSDPAAPAPPPAASKRPRGGGNRGPLPPDLRRPDVPSELPPAAAPEDDACERCLLAFRTRFELGRTLSDASDPHTVVRAVRLAPGATAERARLLRLLRLGGVHAPEVRLVLKAANMAAIADPDERAEVHNEILVGAAMNTLGLRQLSPGFVLLLDWFVCDDVARGRKRAAPGAGCYDRFQYLLSERLNLSVVSYLAAVDGSVGALRAVLFQVCHALHVGWQARGFVHQDLHPGNAMLLDTALPEGEDWLFVADLDGAFAGALGGGARAVWRVPWRDTRGRLVKLIDFGRSRALISTRAAAPEGADHLQGLRGFEQFGVEVERPSRTHDLRTFVFKLLAEVPRAVWDAMAAAAPFDMAVFRAFAARALDAARMRAYLRARWHMLERRVAEAAVDPASPDLARARAELEAERERERAALVELAPALDSSDALLAMLMAYEARSPRASSTLLAIVATLRTRLVEAPGGGLLSAEDALRDPFFASYLELDAQAALQPQPGRRRMNYAPSELPGASTAHGAASLGAPLAAGPHDACTACAAPARSTCAACGAARYCGAACQARDWPAHAGACARPGTPARIVPLALL